jgi:hypothetical protein
MPLRARWRSSAGWSRGWCVATRCGSSISAPVRVPICATSPALRDTARWASGRGLACRAGTGSLVVRGAALELHASVRVHDLAAGLDRLELDRADLVTASALLDLVSRSWLASLARCCAAAGTPLLAALTYDGRVAWTPAVAGDDDVRRLLNHHQLRDKGFGPALGPQALDVTRVVFEAHRFQVRVAGSDWRLGPGAVQMQRALTLDWCRAAGESAPELAARLGAWRAARLDAIEAGIASLVVGHGDLLAMTP